MAENLNGKNISENDTLDINELAALNDDISDDLIEQLQSRVSQDAQAFSGGNDDSQLFEEVQPQQELDTSETPSTTVTEQKSSTPATLNDDLDDNFIKKYKAKLMKQQNAAVENETTANMPAHKNEEVVVEPVADEKPQQTPKQKKAPEKGSDDNNDIEAVSGGNITERALNQEHLDYQESLDYLDNNTKYSKYVIYISPENREFIDSLTVKERKNLINRIIREQDDIAVTKRKLNKTQDVITHTIVAILTITLAIPVIYWAINTSLEATINNYRSSQSMFQTLYKTHGKIKSK